MKTTLPVSEQRLNLSLAQSWPMGVGGGHERENALTTICLQSNTGETPRPESRAKRQVKRTQCKMWR